MNNRNRTYDSKTKCPVCGIWVNNIRKHRTRDRCSMQHIRYDKRRFLKMMKKLGGNSIKVTPKKQSTVAF